jgi:hypothetical protein
METLGGFPNLPALWLRRAKLGSAYAAHGFGISRAMITPSILRIFSTTASPTLPRF